MIRAAARRIPPPHVHGSRSRVYARAARGQAPARGDCTSTVRRACWLGGLACALLADRSARLAGRDARGRVCEAERASSPARSGCAPTGPRMGPSLAMLWIAGIKGWPIARRSPGCGPVSGDFENRPAAGLGATARGRPSPAGCRVEGSSTRPPALGTSVRPATLARSAPLSSMRVPAVLGRAHADTPSLRPWPSACRWPWPSVNSGEAIPHRISAVAWATCDPYARSRLDLLEGLAQMARRGGRAWQYGLLWRR